MDLIRIQYQLEDLKGRKIDLIEKRSILASHNWIRRQNILENAQSIYDPLLNIVTHRLVVQ